MPAGLGRAVHPGRMEHRHGFRHSESAGKPPGLPAAGDGRRRPVHLRQHRRSPGAVCPSAGNSGGLQGQRCVHLALPQRGHDLPGRHAHCGLRHRGRLRLHHGIRHRPGCRHRFAAANHSPGHGHSGAGGDPLFPDLHQPLLPPDAGHYGLHAHHPEGQL